MQLLKELDIPPVWLALFVALAWLAGRVAPAGFSGGRQIGAGLVAAGVLLMLWAIIWMSRRFTTVIPRRDPSALVTDGPFRWSRNPIYLGDAMILAGVTLICHAPLALLLVPAFVVLITRRYILDEEGRLRRAFGPAFEQWAARTRRWL
jgi:protein-S-isoprenylcysteine O-methyltransferase Ste14